MCGFFPPKAYTILLLKQGCSRLDDLSEVPEHRYLLRALTNLPWLKMSLLSAGGWTRSSLKVPSNLNYPTIYRTEANPCLAAGEGDSQGDTEPWQPQISPGSSRAALVACTALLHTGSAFLPC